MKATTFALLLCALTVTTNASFLETLLNHTKFRGKLHVNTTDGVALKYNASLGLGNELVHVELVNVAAGFEARPLEKGNSSGFNHSVRYAGNIGVVHSGHGANVSLAGVLGAAGNATVTTDNRTNTTQVQFQTRFDNLASFNVSNGEDYVEGRGDATLNVGGLVQKRGQKISMIKTLTGGGNAEGTVVHNGTAIGNFTVTKIGEATVQNVILLRKQSENPAPQPNATFVGRVQYKRANTAEWNNNSAEDIKTGTVDYRGDAWVTSTPGENGTYHALAVRDRAIYGFQDLIYLNDTQVGTLYGAGKVDRYHAHGHVRRPDGNHEVNTFSRGNVHQQTTYYPVPKPDEASDFNPDEVGEYMLDENESQKAKKVVSNVQAAWMSGANFTTSKNQDNNTVVHVTSAANWTARGSDNVHSKPWNITGNRTVNGDVEVVKIFAEDDNVTMQVGNKTRINITDFAKRIKEFFGWN